MTSEISAAQPTQTTWGQGRRLEFLDFRLHWDGRINRSALTDFFNISVPQASLDISKYLELAPGNAVYDRSSKVYQATANFQPYFPNNVPERYLNELLAIETDIIRPEQSFIGWRPPVAAVPTPVRSVPDRTLIGLLSAIRDKTKVIIRYQSMTTTEPSSRLISPHAIANDGFRWHVRAYCDQREKFIDFVIARILEISVTDVPGADSANDQGWNRVVKLVLCANPALAEGHRRVIELDYGMTDGVIELNCRQALLYYALKRLGLHKFDSDVARPEKQQIALKNYAEVKKFLPRSDAPR
ncbi:WYL domain-containing protein [Janthinobacterium sp. 67]|uniref:WYL domain-containing protein n=1 Tax=Janthinobacterium sp. 67 TaxID=2035207 RepID=UPI000C2402C5|nr:WYL domain-containing protein [Janthinobacterium sp. 67]PJJ18879.1 WYL domain-containing protein [Janthinobacterium sp. 67]